MKHPVLCLSKYLNSWNSFGSMWIPFKILNICISLMSTVSFCSTAKVVWICHKHVCCMCLTARGLGLTLIWVLLWNPVHLCLFNSPWVRSHCRADLVVPGCQVVMCCWACLSGVEPGHIWRNALAQTDWTQSSNRFSLVWTVRKKGMVSFLLI